MHLESELSQELLKASTRRHFFKQTGFGIGAAALTNVLAQASAPTGPMFPAKAKSIIYLFMAGAPSQVDLFDGLRSSKANPNYSARRLNLLVAVNRARKFRSCCPT
jgi:hypothetical protein